MAGKIPAGEFNARITLNGEQPIQTIKSLKSEVAGATSAWKAQVSALRQAGDQLGAAQAKFDGLSAVLNKQQELLEKNKTQLNELKQAQAQVDTTTENGQKQFEIYARQIATAERNVSNATTKIAKLSEQQNSAKNSLDYYKSGLASAQTELRKISDSSQAYINRLEAEGKHEEANKERLNSLSQQYSTLNDIYKIQSNELKKIASETGSSSEAYRKQKIRVDETATSLAKTKSEMGNLSSEMKKANPSIFDKIKEKISGVKSETKETGGLFKKIFSANILSDAVSNAFSTISSGLKSTISSGMELNGVLGKIKGQWSGLGKSANEINILTEQMKYLKENTNMSADQVQNLQVQMNRLTSGNTEKTVALSKSISVLGDNTKMSGDQMNAFAASMARALSGSKLSAGQFQRMAKAAPGLSAAMAKAGGMSEATFNRLANSGKMSTKQFEQLFEKVGNDGGKAFEKFRATQGGATKSMKDSWEDLKQKMTAPLFNAKTSGMQQLANIMQDKSVQQGASLLGKGLNQIAIWATQGLKYIADHKKDISEIAQDVLKIGVEVGKSVWKVFSSIIIDIANAFGLTSKNAKKSKDPMDQFANAMDGLAKNKTAIKAIADAIVAIAAVKGITTVSKGLIGIYKAGKLVNGVLKAAPDKWAAFKDSGLKAIGQLKDGFGGLKSVISKAISGQSFGGAFQSLKSAGGFGGLSTAGKFATAATGVGVALDAGSSIVSAFKDKKGSTKQFQDAGKGIGTAIGGGIGMAFGGPIGATIGSQIGKLAGGWGGKATKQFLDGWKSKKPPKNFWSIENLGWSTKDAFGKMNKGIGDWWNGIKKNNQKAAKENAKVQKQEDKQRQQNQKAWNNYWKKAGKGWNSYWGGVGKTISKGWNGIKKNTSNGVKNVGKFVDDFHKNGTKNWGKYRDEITKKGSKYWEDLKSHSSGGTRKLLDNVENYAKDTGKSWKDHWSNVTKGWGKFSDQLNKNHGNWLKTIGQSLSDNLQAFGKSWQNSWNNITKLASDWGNNIKKWFSNFGKDWQNGWNDIKSGVENIFKKMWQNIKNGASDAVNGLIDILNGAIGAVDTVISKFGGSKNAIGKIKHVHFATGTGAFGNARRAITEPTLAIVNDGNDSPATGNREALFRPATGEFGVFKGRNTETVLMPGDEVLNASETAMMMQAMGYEHFAGGTGFFGNFFSNVGKTISSAVGGISNSVSSAFGGIGSWVSSTTDGLKKFFELAKKIISNPGSYLNKVFKFDNPNSGAFKDLTNGMFNTSKKQADNWWKSLWSMVSGQLDDGSGAEGGLLGAMEKYGHGKPYVWGATGPDAFDCSGLVQYTVEKAYGKAFPHYSGSQYNATVGVSDPQPGDLVFFGPGGSNHVGVYAGGGRYYSAQSPAAGIGMGRVADVNEGPISYRRIPGLNTSASSSSSGSSVKASGALQTFIKKQVGGGFWKFIGKLADMFGLGGQENPGGIGVARWEQTVVKALKANGFDATPFQVSSWMKVIDRESKGDPHAVNNWDSNAAKGTPSKGLVQTIQPTFDAYAFKGHHDIWNGYDDLLAGINYMKHKYGSSSSAFSRVASSGYANGGIATEASIFGEAGPEMAIPLSAVKSSRSYELIGQTAAIMAAQDPQLTNNSDNKLNKKLYDALDNIQSLLAVLITNDTTIETNVKIGDKVIATQLDKSIRTNLATAMQNRRLNFSGR